VKNFLVIEDNADDALLIKRAFSVTQSCHASICRNLSEARAYLQGAGIYSDRQKYPFPNAVISDLHLGFESAVDFLRWIKASEEFKSMPVIVLSGTASTRECALAKDMGALEVLKKPARYEDLKGMIQDLVSKLCA
jgi:DNA-binding response OmpR family regulator